MPRMRHTAAPIAIALCVALPVGSALAQTENATPLQQQQHGGWQSRIGQILGQILNGRSGNSGTLEAEWAAGRFPLATRRADFEARVDAEVRNGSMNYGNGEQLKREYYSLVQLEARYGEDRRFTTQERSELTARYEALTRSVNEGGYGNTGGTTTGPGYSNYPSYGEVRVAEGQAEFNRRVDQAEYERRISRSTASRLRSDYASLVRLEEQYQRDGYLSDREREELRARLEELNGRVGDSGYGTNPGAYTSQRARLDGIARALPNAGLSSTARAQLRIELEDVSRLEAAYARLNATSEELAYLERRIMDLESRVRIRR